MGEPQHPSRIRPTGAAKNKSSKVPQQGTRIAAEVCSFLDVPQMQAMTMMLLVMVMVMMVTVIPCVVHMFL
eukprot:2296507-Pyramimonas_sp.AAC.1